ncbi:uncharacterized protein BJ212DRAFT_1521347 [Suillus subaureus]|uniref:Uncharacterized protein n=1 Tax=Suillus subaureus TaxID=48587 RepID=A0A9P7E5Q6_9AGAM|nr:uncharacterized protein BJ212DRAFT_1521347 [Suillus subaureus]KAG1811840.1 hypothetical protein BJ212DRAFT_1521347 [Suillus subaureus]
MARGHTLRSQVIRSLSFTSHEAWVNLNKKSLLFFYSRLLLFAASFQFAMATAHVTLMFVQATIGFTNTTIAATKENHISLVIVDAIICSRTAFGQYMQEETHYMDSSL